ncbi:TIGR03936 family radical SAM-associated protein [Marispirochaeta aestuarii]|uniref:TIGR03936 family radical SAM-associated protein n=1 Tax=Marispirochaeta aestuarii TaxID=1963862 RepID=UPI002ABE7C08|nr:TIGR03936 family radical SAM-associated protein [Marispirochaeta aestuarii]
MRTNILEALGNSLLSVEKPARYVGGEYAIIRKPEDTRFRIALSFPDLYEIGMSNYSIRILYSMLNALEDVACERIFVPAPDFEELLNRKKLPLFSLENASPVRDFDILAFTVGYELSATSILSVLDMGGVPLRRVDRGPGDPIVVAGGSALTNPAPFSNFLDAVFIGEAEQVWSELIERLRDAKSKGAGRRELLELVHQHPNIWYPGKSEKTSRAVWQGFGCNPFFQKFPLPGMSAVQDHGVVEIMRGCPNGCRFCHAGVVYRPHREKDIDIIMEEAEHLFHKYGYREITLSSLSTGDYSQLQSLVDRLTARFSDRQVSFSLPSLRVNSFTLPILNRISEVRKSGLTFAVETPELAGQLSINKEVPAERIIEILNAAKKFGWRSAKFYFMIGLPQDSESTPQAIIDYLEEIRKKTGVRIHLTVNTFIPKPHTPFQRSYQLSEEKALNTIHSIRNGLNRKLYKFGYHSPFASILEGLISRGGERVGGIIEKAYYAGARLDAWEEYLDRDLWRKILQEESWDPISEVSRPRSADEVLPWDSIDMGVRKSYLEAEYRRAEKGELTDPCKQLCRHNCGACDDEKGIDLAHPALKDKPENKVQPGENTRKFKRFLFSFTKEGPSRFLSHKNLVSVFQRLFTRQEIPVQYTQGFNPKPKLEFAHPLSLGVSSYHEVAMIFLEESFEPREFSRLCNTSMPEGMRISSGTFFDFPQGVKSVMSYYHGSDYELKVRRNFAETHAREIENLFSPHLDTPLEKEEYIVFRFFYPDGKADVKGINRLLRSSFTDNLEEFKLTRIKTYFRSEHPDSVPVSLPGSSSGP